MTDTKRLYQQDVVLWSQQQAAGLRAAAHSGSNLDLDWENLAEEIESVGISQRSALKSQIQQVIEHLLKLEFSPARYPRSGWINSTDDARDEIEKILEDSPSLKSEIETAIELSLKRAVRRVPRDLQKYGEIDPTIPARMQNKTYTAEQIVGDWFPPEPEREI